MGFQRIEKIFLQAQGIIHYWSRLEYDKGNELYLHVV